MVKHPWNLEHIATPDNMVVTAWTKPINVTPSKMMLDVSVPTMKELKTSEKEIRRISGELNHSDKKSVAGSCIGKRNHFKGTR